MWCPEGYVTLSEIMSQFMWDTDIVPPASNKPVPDGFYIDTGLDQAEISAFRSWAIAAFFEIFRQDVRACLPSGIVVRLTPDVFAASVFCYNAGFRHRLGPFPLDYEERLIWSETEFPNVNVEQGVLNGLAQALEPIRGAVLCIDESILPVRMDDLTMWIMAETTKRREPNQRKNNDFTSKAHEIVAAFEAAKIRTKPEAQRMFGKGMKTEAWLALWREACNLMPELARPGPRYSGKS